MKLKIFSNILLVIVGVALGFWALINWQLHTAIKQATAAAVADSQSIGQLEKYLQDTYLPKQTEEKK